MRGKLSVDFFDEAPPTIHALRGGKRAGLTGGRVGVFRRKEGLFLYKYDLFLYKNDLFLYKNKPVLITHIIII